MLEQVREAGLARPLVLRADVIPEVHRDDRARAIFVQQDVESVVERVLREREVQLSEAAAGQHLAAVVRIPRASPSFCSHGLMTIGQNATRTPAGRREVLVGHIGVDRFAQRAEFRPRVRRGPPAEANWTAAVSIVDGRRHRAPRAAVAMSAAFAVTPVDASDASAVVNRSDRARRPPGSALRRRRRRLRRRTVAREPASNNADHERDGSRRPSGEQTRRQTATSDSFTCLPHDGQRNRRRSIVTRERNLRGHPLGRRHERACDAGESGSPIIERHTGVAAFANRLIDGNRGR